MDSGGRGPDDLVSVIDIAEELGVLKQTVFKITKRLGIEAQKVRDPSRGNQSVSFVTPAEAKRVITEYTSNMNSGDPDATAIGDLATSSDIGFFYLIQLEPEHDSGRFKVGFAANMKDRLRKHRCSAPYATVVATWPSRRIWERTAIDCVTEGCEQIHTEVFRADTIDDVHARGNAFFELMPSLDDEEDG